MHVTFTCNCCGFILVTRTNTPCACFFFWYMCLGCLSVMIRCCWFFYASLRLCCTFILRKHAHSWRVRCFGVFVSGWGVFDCAFFAFALQLAFIGFGGCSWVLSVYCVYGFVCAVCFFFFSFVRVFGLCCWWHNRVV